MKHYEITSKKLFEQIKLLTPTRVRAIRAQYNLTQVAFADLLDIAYHTYRAWETGKRRPCTSSAALLIIAEKNQDIFLKKRLYFIKTITKLFKDIP